jgi:hypothetical protein
MAITDRGIREIVVLDERMEQQRPAGEARAKISHEAGSLPIIRLIRWRPDGASDKSKRAWS